MLKMNHIRKILIILALVCLVNPIWADSNGIIKGKVTDINNNPIEFATIALLNPVNDHIIKGEMSNNKGEFVIENIQTGTYKIKVTMLGFVSFDVTIKVENSNPTNIQAILKEEVQELNSVIVTAKKPLIEQSEDKLIINPEASITMATENVFEILKKLPGVNIDSNDNITLKGVQGVKILIDGKLTYVNSDQLASILKGMLGKNIDKIEIIENPPAKYDAEGTAGMINIKTKHNKSNGLNGSMYVNAGIAKKPNENTGVDLNVKQGKLNLYSNIGLWENRGFHDIEVQRNFLSEALLGASQDILMKSNSYSKGYNLKFGADYNIDKNKVISAMIRTNEGSFTNNTINTTNFINPDQIVETQIITPAKFKIKWDNQVSNINYKWDIDTLGRNITADMDWAHFGFSSATFQNSNYYDGNNNPVSENVWTNTDQNNDIEIMAAKIDYVHPLSTKYTIETGAKISFVTNDSFIDMTGEITQSDAFNYKESIQAGYLIAKLKLSNTSFQFGVRLENTISEGHSQSLNQTDKKEYFELFPSFYTNHKWNDNNVINLKYSYRIGRPNYNLLNPFRWMLDPYTTSQGNPFLKPEFTHTSGLVYTYKNNWVTSLNFYYTKNSFSEYIYQNDETKVLIQTMENLGKTVDASLSESFHLKLFPWWQLNASLTGMYKKINVQINNHNTFEKWSFTGNMNNSFTLPRMTTIELSGFYNSDQLLGNFMIESKYKIDIAIQKKILNEMGTLKFTITDVFSTFENNAIAKYDNIDIKARNTFDSTRATLSFTYRFGKESNISNRSNRATSSSDEQNRSGK